jgi:hypothetical protein
VGTKSPSQSSPAHRKTCVPSADGDRRQRRFARPGCPRQRWREHDLRASRRGDRVRHGDAQSADRAGLSFRVDEYARFALCPQLHRLRAMHACSREAQHGEVRLPHDLGEGVAARNGCGRNVQQPQGVLETDQRPHRVDRGAVGVGLAEDVVEHLERKWSAVAGVEHVAGERRQVEVPLPREEPVVATPLQNVHRQRRRIGQLQEEDLLAGYRADGPWIVPFGQDVEAVEADAECRVSGTAHDPPRVLVAVDVPAPCQCLVGDAQAAFTGTCREQVQLLGREIVVVDGVRRHRRAHQHGVHAQFGHDVELVLGAAQVGGQHVRWHRFEVAERLVQVDAQTEAGAALPDLRRTAAVGEQVVLEQLDAVEARLCGRGQFVVQRAGQAHGGDGGAQIRTHARVLPPALRSARACESRPARRR